MHGIRTGIHSCLETWKIQPVFPKRSYEMVGGSTGGIRSVTVSTTAAIDTPAIESLVHGLKQKNSNESAGPCPFCGGTDRFLVWKDKQNAWCRQCGFKGGANEIMHKLNGIGTKGPFSLVSNIGKSVPAKTNGRIESQEKAAIEANKIWDSAKEAPDNHPYLLKKGVRSHGLKLTSDGSLNVPVQDSVGNIHSLLKISPKGEKRFLPNGKIKGHFFVIFGSDHVYIVEGYATGATIHQLTGATVVVAFNAGNLKPVAEKSREIFSGDPITIAADNDQSKTRNVGLEKAKMAATAINCEVVVPRFKKDDPDASDFNDLANIEGEKVARAQLLSKFNRIFPGKKKNSACEIISAFDLGRMEIPPTKWIVPGLIPEGLTIFGGKPKRGKSIAMLCLSLSIAIGGKALGYSQVEPGGVLYLALEDTRRRLQERLKKMHPSGDLPKNLFLINRFPRFGDGGKQGLINAIKDQSDLRFVIIDTFKKIRRSDKLSKNMYDRDYEAIDEIKAVADDHGVGIIIVHHLNKMVSEDVFDTFSGSLGLTGAADTLIALERASGSDRAILHIDGRDVEADQLSMKFDPRFLSWTITGPASEIETTEHRAKILDVLKKANTPLSPTQIAEQSQLTYQYVRNTLPRMNRVQRIGRGKYRYDSFTED